MQTRRKENQFRYLEYVLNKETMWLFPLDFSQAIEPNVLMFISALRAFQVIACS